MAKKAGYNTKQRDLILNCLKAHRSEHVTAESILTCLKQEGASVGQTTVYRNLDRLIREGAVAKYAGSEGQGACFQYLGCEEDCAAHYHLVCAGCGQMLHLQCEYLDEMTAHVLKHHQFSIDRYKTVIYGLCNQCAARSGKE